MRSGKEKMVVPLPVAVALLVKTVAAKTTVAKMAKTTVAKTVKSKRAK